MYLTGVLVAMLFAVASCAEEQGIDKSLAAKTTQDSQAATAPSASKDVLQTQTSLARGMLDGETVMHMAKFCFFSKFPSATCRFRCHLMDKDAFCVGAESDHLKDGEGKCECHEAKPAISPEGLPQDLFAKPETHKEQEADKVEKEGKKPQDILFTIPLHTAPQEPEEDQNKHHVVFYVFDVNKIFGPQAEGMKPEGELPEPRPTFNLWVSVILFLIVLLLFILIGIELYGYFKKQKAKRINTDTIFKNIPMPNKA